MPSGISQLEPFNYEEVQIGDKWISLRRTVTEADVVNFLNLGRLLEPIFVDRVYYEEKTMFTRDWQARLVPGFCLLCFQAGFVHQIGIMNLTGLAYLGMDELRVKNPTFIGDTVHLVVEAVEKKTPKNHPDRCIINFSMSMMNQRDEVALHSYQQLLYRPVSPEEAAGNY